MKTLLTILKEHIEWRHQILKLAKSDIKMTYSGAALGWAWALVKPTVMIFVFWFAFTYGLRAGGEVGDNKTPFILWLIAGFVPWFFMSEMITSGSGSFLNYRYLITKMKFPVSTIPTFVAISKVSVHLFLMVAVVAIYTISGYYPDIYLLQFPFYTLLMMLWFIPWALFSSMLSAVSKDFQNLVRSFVTAIFWLSGIMWDVNTITHAWLKTLLMFNPVTFIATGYRNAFAYKVWFWEEPHALLYFCIMLVVMEMGGIWAYKKLVRKIPDYL